jgi:hypothetical protein
LENKQFSNDQNIHFNDLINNKLIEFGVLFQDKELRYTMKSEGEFEHPLDPILGNMLVENLLSNVIKHATPGTNFTVSISSNKICIQNLTQSIVSNEALFERFKKGQESNKSTGLGLSIVRGITDNCGLHCDANIQEGVFEVEIWK